MEETFGSGCKDLRIEPVQEAPELYEVVLHGGTGQDYERMSDHESCAIVISRNSLSLYKAPIP